MDKLLFPVTDWNERIATRGRGSGNLIRERFVVGMDNRTFILGTQSKDDKAPIVGFKFASKIHQFIPLVARETNIDNATVFNLLLEKINDGSFSFNKDKSINDNLMDADIQINPFGLFPGKEYRGG